MFNASSNCSYSLDSHCVPDAVSVVLDVSLSMLMLQAVDFSDDMQLAVFEFVYQLVDFTRYMQL